MAEIQLNRGYVALVDDEDMALVKMHRWYADIHGTRVYAKTNALVGGRRTTLLMHRLILGADEIDHKEGIGLDNRRHNLRPCTPMQNAQNKAPSRHTSAYKGVSICNRTGRWQAHIRVNDKNIFLGRYVEERRAAEAYDAAARKHFGGFARTNFTL